MIVCNYWMVVCKYWMFDQEYILWFSGVAVFFWKAVPIAKPAGCLEIASCGTYLDLEMVLFSAPTLFGRICALMDGPRRFFPGKIPLENARKEFSLENAQSGKMSTVLQLRSFGEKKRWSSMFSSNENLSALFRLCTYG